MDIFALRLSPDGVIQVSVSLWLLGFGMTLGLTALLWRLRQQKGTVDWFEVDEAELGIGAHKVKLKPNRADLQVAYRLWIELSTRKIGLPLDLEHDVITQIYDSWYEFFKVTRGLLKDIPASKLRATKSTQDLIRIAIDVLNEGLRPHLTRHQARFRRWMDHQLATEASIALAPQDLQLQYPAYADLKKDMELVNRKLMRYRAKLKEIVFADAAHPPDDDLAKAK